MKSVELSQGHGLQMQLRGALLAFFRAFQSLSSTGFVTTVFVL